MIGLADYIIGFHAGEATSPLPASKPLFDGERVSYVPHINGYLLPAPDVVIDNRTRPLCDVPAMDFGNMPNDGGNLLLTSKERDAVLREEPALSSMIRPFVGAVEFINRKCRYCFWLVDASPAFLRASPILRARVEAVSKLRLARADAGSVSFACLHSRFKFGKLILFSTFSVFTKT